MENQEMIKYVFTNIKCTETIIIYNDRVVYTKNDLGIAAKYDSEPTENYKISIKDAKYVSSIIDTIYKPMKKDILKAFDTVSNLPKEKRTRPKNTSKKQLIINDEDFTIKIDMFIQEYGPIFDNLIDEIKRSLFSQFK